jgi:Rieske Fe-S protein
MERKDFLSKFGIGMALVCAGCGIASCGSSPKNEDPQPQQPGGGGGGGQTPGGNLLSANLESELRNIGDFKIAGGVILVRLAAGNAPASFTAVQVACTHQGTSVAYNNAQSKFICPNHFSEFSTTGAVLKGPATGDLKKYTVAVTGSNLSVTA